MKECKLTVCRKGERDYADYTQVLDKSLPLT